MQDKFNQLHVELFVDDLYRCKSGLEKQFYDAFLLYADEDFEFAKEMIEKLEQQNLRVKF